METFKNKSSKLYVGDCLELFKKIKSESIDIVVTSPPYNLGIKYKSYKDKKSNNEYLDWIRDVSMEIKRTLKPNGSYFLNVGSTNSNPWLSYDIANSCREIFTLQNHVIWNKSISIGDESFGHFKPINSKRYLNHLYEDIFHFTKDGNVDVDRISIGVPYMDKSNVSRWSHGKSKRCRGDSWFLPYETIQSREKERGDHPATFPLALPAYCISLHGFTKKSVVLDPFLGTGTTLVAAKLLGLKSIGFELDADYAKDAWNRINPAK